MMDQDTAKRAQTPGIASESDDPDGLVRRLMGNGFARGFSIGTMCAMVFWTLYLW